MQERVRDKRDNLWHHVGMAWFLFILSLFTASTHPTFAAWMTALALLYLIRR